MLDSIQVKSLSKLTLIVRVNLKIQEWIYREGGARNDLQAIR